MKIVKFPTKLFNVQFDSEKLIDFSNQPSKLRLMFHILSHVGKYSRISVHLITNFIDEKSNPWNKTFFVSETDDVPWVSGVEVNHVIMDM